MTRFSCPNCRSRQNWRVRRGNRKCSQCKTEFSVRVLPLHLTRYQWKQLLKWFVLGLSSNKASFLTGLDRKRVIRALNLAREVMARDVPREFSGVVEVDETYLGGQWKNKPKSVRARGTKRGRGTSKQPAFGILARSGVVWAELVDDVEASTLLPLLKKQVRKGSIVCSDTFTSYTGLATQGYVHRLVKHSEGEYSDGRGTHINGLEGFWGYLKRQLASKGGIRRSRLPLYLAEYVWKYNHRTHSVNQQVLKLLRLLSNRRTTSG